MYSLDVESTFSAAHQLREYKGKCENLHGHNWRVRVTVEGDQLDAAGMLVDFGVIKAALRGSLAAFDHTFLNELPPFLEQNPTSENLARHLAETLVGPGDVRISGVTVWESETCRATYRP